MRYPFQPDILDAMPEPLAELYRGLEDELLRMICSRLFAAGELNEVTVQAIRALRAQGIDLKDIEKAIQKTVGISERQLDQLLDDVVARNQEYYTDLIDKTGVTAPETLVDASDIDAIRRQTHDAFANITQSTGFLVDGGRTMLEPAKAYQWALDSAMLQIESGAVSYTTAIASAVRQLADSGIRTAVYESGHTDHIDVAVRRAIQTGISQISGRYTEQSAEYLGTDLFEVSAHVGARDTGSGYENHKAWQGKVYSTTPNHPKYPNIYTVCGLGQGGGLEGWNCRHRRWAFVEGVSERTYTDEDLQRLDRPPFTYQGRQYSAYAATQKQREIERTIRKHKRRQTAYEAAGLKEDATANRARLRRLNAEYKAFSEAAGLPLQQDRLRVLDVENIKSKPEKVYGYTDKTDSWASVKKRKKSEVVLLDSVTVGGKTYQVDGTRVINNPSSNEQRVAELLAQKIGGQISIVPRVNSPQKVKTADFVIHGIHYDLKTLSNSKSKNAVYNRLNPAQKQANNFILDITGNPLGASEILEQTKSIFWSKHTRRIQTVVVIDGEEIIAVYERA